MNKENKIKTEDFVCHNLQCNCDKIHIGRVKENLKTKFKCMALGIGHEVMHKGDKKTVISLCTSSAILSEKSWFELCEMQVEDFREHLKECYSKGENGWIDLDEIELISDAETA